jgi:hypothetical protein
MIVARRAFIRIARRTHGYRSPPESLDSTRPVLGVALDLSCSGEPDRGYLEGSERLSVL